MNPRKDKRKISIGKETYLLKIYRRSPNPEESLVGTIEDIKGEKRGAFKTAGELFDWLEKTEGK